MVMVSQANPFDKKNVANFTTDEIIGGEVWLDKMTHAKGTFTLSVLGTLVLSPLIQC